MDLHRNFFAHGVTPERGYAGSDGSSPWSHHQSAPHIGAPRHFAVQPLADGKTVAVNYTSRGERPESIYRTTMAIDQGDFRSWTTTTTGDPWVHKPILKPELPWEGAERPLTWSRNGAEHDSNALRDPYVFTDDDGQAYLLYAGGPEEAIALPGWSTNPSIVLRRNDRTAHSGE
jgi:hypothetical protein